MKKVEKNFYPKILKIFSQQVVILLVILLVIKGDCIMYSIILIVLKIIFAFALSVGVGLIVYYFLSFLWDFFYRKEFVFLEEGDYQKWKDLIFLLWKQSNNAAAIIKQLKLIGIDLKEKEIENIIKAGEKNKYE